MYNNKSITVPSKAFHRATHVSARRLEANQVMQTSWTLAKQEVLG